MSHKHMPQPVTYRSIQSRVYSFPSTLFPQHSFNRNCSPSSFDTPQALPVIIKLEPQHSNNRPSHPDSKSNSHSHKRSGLSIDAKSSQMERSANEAKDNSTPLANHCYPIPLFNHVNSKSAFHNTFNRNFYNTKYVYSAMKSNIYQCKEKRENELFQLGNEGGSDSQSQSSFSQVNPNLMKIKIKKILPEKSVMELNKTVKDGFRNQIQAQVNAKANQTGLGGYSSTSGQEMPVMSKSILKQYHYSIEKQFALSKAGRDYTGATKMNQDSYVMRELKINGITIKVIGVFDGHGLNGHKISRSIRSFITNLDLNGNSASSSSSQVSIWPHEQSKAPHYHLQLFKDKSYAFIYKLFASLSHNVCYNKGVDAQLSGSTCVLLFHSGHKLICANCGDSRSILIQENGSVIQLSRDHKPNLPDERKRIESQGGRVDKSPCYYGEGPYRVWLKNESYPGLAMSRSIGDVLAHSIGVSSEPEIREFNLSEFKPKILVTASDGVWEFLSNEQVSRIVYPFYLKGDCEGASKQLVDEAQRMWERESLTMVDDITVIISFF